MLLAVHPDQDANQILLQVEYTAHKVIFEFRFSIENIETKSPTNPTHLNITVLNHIEALNAFHIPQEIFRGISKIHNTAEGHFGVNETLRMIKEKGLLQKAQDLNKCVEAFVHQCPVCQKLRGMRDQVRTNPFTLASDVPFKRINIDTIGPLPKNKDGFEHILVMIDCFSRWIELVPLRTTKAEEAAQALIAFLGRYGDPETILSDRGTQFVNNIVDDLIQKLAGFQKEVSVAYSKEENAIVERANQEVIRHLKAIVMHTKIKDEWDLYLPFVQRILNSHVHESTGFAPYQLIMPSVTMEQRIFPVPAVDMSMSEYSTLLMARQETVIQVAQQTQTIVDQTNKRKRAVSAADLTVFPVNSYVLRTYPPGRMGQLPPDKLMARKAGPFKVTKIEGNNYTLLNLMTNKLEPVCNITRLSEYIYDEQRPEQAPYTVAQVDQSMWDVEEIVRISQGSFKGKDKDTKLWFEVKWVGYEEPTKESWKLFKFNAVLHEWMRANNYTKYIPRSVLQPPGIV